jgi:hypothetical protein
MSTKEQRRKLAAKKSRKKNQESRTANYPRPKFSAGNLIQVNDDVMDYDWGNLPIGGWVGKITEIHREKDGPKYDVDWSDETMKKCHPIYEKLANLEDLNFGTYCRLDEDKIHAFTGGKVMLVNPDPNVVSHYTDRPLDPDDKDDRIRMIFGTHPLDWFPTLGEDEETDTQLLKRYYDYLSELLALPFEAKYIQRGGGRTISERAFTVKSLINPDTIKPEGRNESDGLFCFGLDPVGNMLEVPLRKIYCDTMPHEQLLDDYREWMCVVIPLYEWWRLDSDDDEDEDE